jgi:hypothetical protein
MIKHVGRHNNKKVVILYRTVPDDEHMCLVTYTETLPRMIHDELMHCLESPIGQNAKEFSDALFRQTMADGNNALHSLHVNGFIKKVPANQVLVTPKQGSSVRLDELNDILKQMEQGEEAVRRLADMDSSRGMNKKKTRLPEAREVGAPNNSRANAGVQGNTSAEEYVANTILTDSDIAISRLAQAKTFKQQAEQLLAEAKRLEDEAQTLDAGSKKNVTTKTKKTAAKKQAA